MPALTVLPTACFRLKIGNQFTRLIRIICDSGSQTNVMASHIVKEFKLIRSATTTRIRGVGGKLAKTKGEVQLELWHHKENTLVIRARFVVIPDNIPEHPQRSFKPEQFSRVVNENLADPHYYEQGPIEALMGVGVLSEHIKEGIERNSVGLLAQNTSFGWIVSGEGLMPETKDSLYTIGTVVKDELRSLIHRLWEIDEMNERSLSAED